MKKRAETTNAREEEENGNKRNDQRGGKERRKDGRPFSISVRTSFFFRFFFFVPVKNKTKKKTFLHGAAATVVRDLKTTGVVVQITLGANQV